MKPKLIKATYLDAGCPALRGLRTQHRLKFLMVSCVAFSATFLGADAQSKQTCDKAAWAASAKTGFPLAVLQANSRSETRRTISGKLQSWPMAVKVEGNGKLFNSHDEELIYLGRNHRDGSRSFYINFLPTNFNLYDRYFKSIIDMSGPDLNILYADRFLNELCSEKGDWSTDAGIHHSRVDRYVFKYLEVLDEVYKDICQVVNEKIKLAEVSGLDDALGHKALPNYSLRIDKYPLFQEGIEKAGLGFLVPLYASNLHAIGLFASNEDWVGR